MQKNTTKIPILYLKFNSEETAQECLSLLSRSGWHANLRRDATDPSGRTYWVAFSEEKLSIAYEVAYMLTNMGYHVTLKKDGSEVELL